MTDLAALLQPDRGQPARTIEVVHPDAYEDWLKGQPKRTRAILTAQKVTGKAGNKAILPGDGEDWSALLICDEDASSPWRIASQPGFLPEGHVSVEGRRGRRGGARLAARAIPVRPLRQVGQGQTARAFW